MHLTSMQPYKQDLLTQKKKKGINILLFFCWLAQMKTAWPQAGGNEPGLWYSATGNTHF